MLEFVDVATVHALPGALLPNMYGDGLVEGAVAADHEDVVVGDGAEGLILHGQIGALELAFDEAQTSSLFIE